MILLGLLATVAASVPTTAVAAPVAPKPSSLQARFDQASKDSFEGRCVSALPIFDDLLKLPAVERRPAVKGAITVRRASCLMNGHRQDEARDGFTAGLTLLPKEDKNFQQDRFDALIGLAKIDYLRLDFGAAKPFLMSALNEAPTPVNRLSAEMWLARATMFDNDDAALTHADAAIAVGAAIPQLSKKELADLSTLHARVLLNRGQVKPALEELRRSLAKQGGLTMRVGASEVITRSDLAIASLLSNNREAAREYLAYTGAGRFDKAPFATAVTMATAPCGGPAGIRPDDAVIVEFAISDDGAVTYAHPVWASRRGPIAVEFARAVKGWSWRPSDAQKIPLLFRVVTRVEMRCTNAADRTPASATIVAALRDWLFIRSLPAAPFAPTEALELPLLKSALKAQPQSEELQQLPILIRIGENRTATDADRRDALAKAVGIATSAAAPVAVRTYLMISLAQLDDSMAKQAKPISARLSALATDPAIAGDAISLATVRLFAADSRSRDGKGDVAAAAALDAVIADDRLPPLDPLRTAALVRLADIQAARGKLDEAKASYARTGLSPEQCALMGTAPAITKTNAYATSFPDEARRWGFEGWVQFETDVTVDGRSTNQRATIAYPPFVFQEAAISVARNIRFAQSYRPDSMVACTGFQSNIRFQIEK